VSAVLASPADSGVVVADKVPLDKVRALQHTLYRTAKADPGRRFHQPDWNRHRTQGRQALAGETECRR